MKNRALLFLLVFLTVLLACQHRAAAQNSPIDSTLAAQHFQEADALCRSDAGELWGVSLCAPIMFVDRKTRAIVASQPDKENALAKNGNVFVGKLPEQINIANTAVEWSGVKWAMVIVPLPADKIRRANLLAHEMWHLVQNEIGFPASGAANNHLDSRAGRVWLQLEWRALTAALVSLGRQRRRAIADALLFRARRRTIFPDADKEERQMEMHEGLAEYTGVKLSGSQNPNQFVIDRNIAEVLQKETFVRSFAYASGPAYGVLLDETKADWRKNLKKEDDLANLLQKQFSIKLLPPTVQTVESRARRNTTPTNCKRRKQNAKTAVKSCSPRTARNSLTMLFCCFRCCK